jgi:hypothetical protein
VYSSNILFELHKNNVITFGAKACQGIIFVLLRIRERRHLDVKTGKLKLRNMNKLYRTKNKGVLVGD